MTQNKECEKTKAVLINLWTQLLYAKHTQRRKVLSFEVQKLITKLKNDCKEDFDATLKELYKDIEKLPDPSWFKKLLEASY